MRIAQDDVSRRLAEARAEGLADGARQGAAHFEEELARERKRVAEMVLQFQRQREEYYAKVEIELVHLALAIAAKILHRESQVDRMVLAGLVKVMLEKLQQNTRVVVRVRPEDAKGWATLLPRHRQPGNCWRPHARTRSMPARNRVGCSRPRSGCSTQRSRTGLFRSVGPPTRPNSAGPK